MKKSDLNLIKEISKLSLEEGDILVVKAKTLTKILPKDLSVLRDTVRGLLRSAGLGEKIPVAVFDSNDIELQIISGKSIK